MKISFIVPAYNEEKNIYQCVTSIYDEMHQYNYDFQIIVVDNNCTDNTVKEAERAGTDIILSEQRKGVVYARQKGYENTNAELIAFIDADSRIPYGWFLDVAYHFNDPKVVAVSGTLRFYDYPKLNWYAKQFYKLAQFFHKFFPTIQGGNYVVRKEALDQLKGFDLSVQFWGEDTNIAVRLAKIGKIILDPHLIIYTSGRRMVQGGLINTVGLYIINYFWVNIFRRPLTNAYKDYR